MKFQIILLLSVNVLFAPVAFADKEAGAADAFICDRAFRRERVYLVDTYPYFSNDRIPKIFQDSDTSNFEQAALDAISKWNPVLGAELIKISKELKFVPVDSVEEIPDNIQVPKHCEKIQLAVQNSDDIAKNQVRYNFRLRDRLDLGERGLFRVHEYWIRYLNGPADTSLVRAQILSIVQNNSFVSLLEKANILISADTQLTERKHTITRNAVYFYVTTLYAPSINLAVGSDNCHKNFLCTMGVSPRTLIQSICSRSTNSINSHEWFLFSLQRVLASIRIYISREDLNRILNKTPTLLNFAIEVSNRATWDI